MPTSIIKIDGVLAPALDVDIGQVLTLTNDDDTGVTAWLWQIVDKPTGSTATLSSTTVAAPTVTVDKEGTYLFKLTVNGTIIGTAVAAIPTLLSGLRLPATYERNEASLSKGWAEAVNESVYSLEDRVLTGSAFVAVADAAIPAGVPVRVTGAYTLDNGKVVPMVSRSYANAVSTAAVAGITTSAAGSVNDKVTVRSRGLLSEVDKDTTTVTAGTWVYLTNTGTLGFSSGTNTVPVGIVSSVAVAGRIFVDLQLALTTTTTRAGLRSVLDFGAVGDGVASDNSAILAAQSAGADITLPPGTYRISGDTTLTAALNIPKGAKFSVDIGVTLTIKGPVDAGLYQIFDGLGAVKFGIGSVAQVFPQWWGAKGDGVLTNDDGPAINKAIDSLASQTGNGALGKVKLIGDFVCQTQVRSTPTTGYQELTIEGEGHHGGLISRMRDGTPLLKMGSETTGSTRASTFVLRDFALIGDAAFAQTLLEIRQGQNFTVDSLGFVPQGPAIDIIGCIGGRIVRPLINAGGLRSVWNLKTTRMPTLTGMSYAIRGVTSQSIIYSAIVGLVIESPTIDGGAYPIYFERGDGVSPPVLNNITITGVGYIQNFTQDCFTFIGGPTELHYIYTADISGMYIEGMQPGKRVLNLKSLYKFSMHCVNISVDVATRGGVRAVDCESLYFESVYNLGKFDFETTTQVPVHLIFLNSYAHGCEALIDIPGADPIALIKRKEIMGSTLQGYPVHYGLIMEDDPAGDSIVGMVRASIVKATTGGLRVRDGITTPAVSLGEAIIYVDISDGDLKVKFGDGTVKTLATDT